MSAPLVRYGWTIAFQPQLFARQYNELKAEVKQLKAELDSQAFAQHPQVKLLAAVMEGIKERIAADPYAKRFALSGPLRRYGRLKGLGLPDRYRLFFRPFEAEGRRLLLILWLGDPRKHGDRNDGDTVFSRMVKRGQLPADWESLQREGMTQPSPPDPPARSPIHVPPPALSPDACPLNHPQHRDLTEA